MSRSRRQPAPAPSGPARADRIAASGSVEELILDLLEWIGSAPRPYLEVLEVWRTSCPRLPVWEDANDRGFIARRRARGRGVLIGLSSAGAEHLRAHRNPAARLSPPGRSGDGDRLSRTYRVPDVTATEGPERLTAPDPPKPSLMP